MRAEMSEIEELFDEPCIGCSLHPYGNAGGTRRSLSELARRIIRRWLSHEAS